MKKVINDPKYNFLRLDPIPSKEDVDKYYEKEFYETNSKFFNNSSLDVQEKQSEFFNSKWEKIYENCKRYFNGNLNEKNIFDIGFGFAQSLLFFRDQKKLEVSGIEPSEEGFKYAKSKGINCYQLGIDDIKNLEIKENYDIVMLLNVLEHLRNPALTLSLIREKVLNKKGVLVLEVPNDFNHLQQVANKEFKLDEWWVIPPNHINYFSPNSLISLLRACDYDIFDYYTSFPLEMFLLFGENYVNDRNIGTKCHEKRVRFEKLMIKHGKKRILNQLYKSLAEIGLGRSITIYASPKNDKNEN
jgi:2-polyprenyl-3-methyl-5-hydroxy-6-metoxy-1,4-benzoquinol methylase